MKSITTGFKRFKNPILKGMLLSSLLGSAYYIMTNNNLANIKNRNKLFMLANTNIEEDKRNQIYSEQEDSNNTNSSNTTSSFSQEFQDLLDKYKSKYSEEQKTLCLKTIEIAEKTNNNELLALEEKSYKECNELFNEYIIKEIDVIKNSNKEKDNEIKENKDKKKTELPRFDISKKQTDIYDIYPIKTQLLLLKEILDKHVEECDIQISRNIRGYKMTASLKETERKELTNKIIKAIQKTEKRVFITKEDNNIDIKAGKTKDTSLIDYYAGTFFGVNKNLINYPEKTPHLKLASVYSNFPDDRVIYKNKNISVIINDEDHIKFRVNYNKNNPNDVSIGKTLFYLIDLYHNISSELSFNVDEKFGFITTSVNSSGYGNSVYFKFKIDDDENNISTLVNKLDQINVENMFEYDILQLKEKVKDDNSSTDTNNKHTKLNVSEIVNTPAKVGELKEKPFSFFFLTNRTSYISIFDMMRIVDVVKTEYSSK